MERSELHPQPAEEAGTEDSPIEEPAPTEEQLLEYCSHLYSRLAMATREAHSVMELLRVLKAESKRARKKEQQRKAQEFVNEVRALRANA